jgi:phage FluMu protein Com
MPYMRCPSCGLLAHVTRDGSAEIECARCRSALEKQVQMLPLEESLGQLDGSSGAGRRRAEASEPGERG